MRWTHSSPKGCPVDVSQADRYLYPDCKQSTVPFHLQARAANAAAHALSCFGRRCRRDGAHAQLETHVRRLLVYILAGGSFLFVALGLLTYRILERIGQGFAVFG